jgi:hypothetical protein
MGGFPVALLAVAEGNMLEVLGHVQLDSSGGGGGGGGAEVNVNLSDLCVAPHLHVCAPAPFSKAVQSSNKLQRRGLGSAILRLVETHVSQIIRHAPCITLTLQCAPSLRAFFERAGYAVAATASDSSRAGSPLNMLKSVHSPSSPPPTSCLATAALATSWCGNRQGAPYEARCRT